MEIKIDYSEEIVPLYELKVNGKTVCSACVTKTNKTSVIETISTKENFRRKGYATELLKKIVSENKRVNCIIRKDNFNSIKLFKGLGFKFDSLEKSNFYNVKI